MMTNIKTHFSQFLLITNLTHFSNVFIHFPSLHVSNNPEQFLPDQHTRQSPTQSEIYQMMYLHNSILLMTSTGLLEKCTEGK
jgi:hypothetical protein